MSIMKKMSMDDVNYLSSLTLVFYVGIASIYYSDAVRTIARQFHWTPYEISELYLDDLDMYGVFFWENDVKEYEKELLKNTKRGK